MTFDEDILTLRNMYVKTELTFANIILANPLGRNYDARHAKLFNLLADCCGQAEKLAESLCKTYEIPLKDVGEGFPRFLSGLNNHHVLEKQSVYVIPLDDIIKPFIMFSDNAPDWWLLYQKTKQDPSPSEKIGNMRNVIYAMAGLYTLHHFGHQLSLYGVNAFESQMWRQDWKAVYDYSLSIESTLEERQRPFPSNAFYCMSRYEPE